MSDKRLNAIKEIEFRVNTTKSTCKEILEENYMECQILERIDLIDTLLFDINDFINDLKDE